MISGHDVFGYRLTRIDIVDDEEGGGAPCPEVGIFLLDVFVGEGEEAVEFHGGGIETGFVFDSRFGGDADTEGCFAAAFAAEDKEVFASDGGRMKGGVEEAIDLFLVSVFDGEVPLAEAELGGEAGLLEVHFGRVPVADGVDEYDGDNGDIHQSVVT